MATGGHNKYHINLNEPKYSLREAAPRMKRAEKTLRAWVAEGKLGILRIKGRIFVPESEIQRILDESFVPARDAA